MRTIFTLLLAAAALIITSCSKQKTVTGDYIVVGRCGGIAAIADFYVINNGQLRQDTIHTRLPVPDDINKMQFDVVMPNDRYQKVAHLRESVPNELLTQNNKSFGEVYPDAMSIVVYTTINGIKYKWSFVGTLDKESAAIQKFAAQAELAFY